MYTKPEGTHLPYYILQDHLNSIREMRAEVLARGRSLNEYSLKDVKTKKKVDHIFKDEKDIFEYLGYKYLKPEDRIN